MWQGDMCTTGAMHGRGCVWRMGVCVWQGVCVARGVCVAWGGACLVKGGCMAGGLAWQGDLCTTGGMRATKGMCGGGVHGRGCVWQGVCVAGGVHGGGSVWWRGAGHAWQERQPLQRAVRILLECFLVIHSIVSSLQQNIA